MENQAPQAKPVSLPPPAKLTAGRRETDPVTVAPSLPQSSNDTDQDDALLKDSKQAWLATEVISNPQPLALGGRTGFPDPLEGTAEKESLLGDFQLIRKLAEGAMGTVFKARQVSTGRKVAVKVLFPHLARNPNLLERFYREARTMEQLDHPNIVSGYTVGKENGWHYFAMEYVDGRSLQKWLNLLGRLSVGDALHLILTCARALAHIHDRHLVHRDIKPDNVLITRTGIIKITDLGVAKFMVENLALTETGNSLGTPSFMSPEQARNAKTADGRSDIYALGGMLYCCLTGRPPFIGDTLLALLQAKEAGKFPAVRRLNPEVPKRLELIVDKMIAREVRYRYQTCAEVIKDLESLGRAAAALSFIPSQGGSAGSGDSGEVAVDPAPSPSSSPDAEASSSDLWYVSYRTLQGQSVTRKMTTAQVLVLIEDKDFDVKAKATRNPREGFRALACYREFEPGFLSRVAKTAVDQKTSGFRHLYKKLDEEDRQRQRERIRATMPQQQRLTSTQLLYWFASRGLIVLVVFLTLRFLIRGLIGLFGF
jgi:serine/threonine-protein kinase